MFSNIKNWFDSGTPFIWLNAGAVSMSVLMVIGLISLIAVRGLGHFWPSQVSLFEYFEADGSTSTIVGELVDEETVSKSRVSGGTNEEHDGETVDRYLFKTGNRDITGLDFRWVLKSSIGEQSFPAELMILERREWGNFYGYLQELKENNEVIVSDKNNWDLFQSYLDENDIIHDEIRHIEKDLIGEINYQMERLRLKQRGLELKEVTKKAPYEEIKRQTQSYQDDYDVLTKRLEKLYQQFNKASITATTAEGRSVEIPLSKIVRAYRPNAMSTLH